MIAYILYVPLVVALGVLFFYSARAALRGYGGGKLVPLALLLGAALFGSLYLMLRVDDWRGKWAAVALAGVSVVPLLLPVVGMLLSALLAKLGGEPMRWN